MNSLHAAAPLIGSSEPTATAPWCVGGCEIAGEKCVWGGLQVEVEMVGFGGLQE